MTAKIGIILWKIGGEWNCKAVLGIKNKTENSKACRQRVKWEITCYAGLNGGESDDKRQAGANK